MRVRKTVPTDQCCTYVPKNGWTKIVLDEEMMERENSRTKKYMNEKLHVRKKDCRSEKNAERKKGLKNEKQSWNEKNKETK